MLEVREKPEAEWIERSAEQTNAPAKVFTLMSGAEPHLTLTSFNPNLAGNLQSLSGDGGSKGVSVKLLLCLHTYLCILTA